MELDLLLTRYARLRQDLHMAYAAPAWQSGRIDRLADELTATERAIARCRPRDELTSGAFRTFAAGRHRDDPSRRPAPEPSAG